MKKTCNVTICSTYRIELDGSKLTPEFWEEFNDSIYNLGTDEVRLAEHIAWNLHQGASDFVEGVGLLSEMGITYGVYTPEILDSDQEDYA